MRCYEAGGCNTFRINSGFCTFGVLSPALSASENDASEDSEIEVYIKSIFNDYFFFFIYSFFVDGQLISEVGCFVHEYYFGEYGVYDNMTLTVDFCLDHCKTNGMKLSLIDSGKMCSCSNEMPTTALVSNSQCNYPCTGENGTEGKCGGDYRWNIHAIRF